MNDFLLKFAVTLIGGDSNSTIDNVKTLSGQQVLENGLNLTYFLAGLIAVIVIIVGGIMYATSAGDSGNITKAKNLIMYAAIGLVVVVIAFAVTKFVLTSFA